MLEVEEKQVLELLEKVEKGMKYHDEMCKLFDEAIRMIPRWIPVSERLPEKGQNVIALGSRGGVYVAQYQGSRYWHKLNARCHMCEPTHWMPLPKPPE